MTEYAKSRADAPELAEIVSAASAAEEAERAAEEGAGDGAGGAGGSGRAQKRRRIFADHLRLAELTQGLKEARWALPLAFPLSLENLYRLPSRCTIP